MKKNLDSSEKIPGQIHRSTEKITEKIPEKRGKGQRGPDKGPRRLTAASLQNLKPYAKYGYEIQRPDNSWIWIAIAAIGTFAVLGLVVWWIYQKDEEEAEE